MAATKAELLKEVERLRSENAALKSAAAKQGAESKAALSEALEQQAATSEILRVIGGSPTDTGVGIAPEDQEAVFEEFRQVGTAAKKVEGTGLGLALWRKFVELHGGRIWVNSQVGVGSPFTFTLPVRRGE